ncbi:MAG: Sir2 family NAD-dependent protein deacetylase [Fimbriimonas sp.]
MKVVVFTGAGISRESGLRTFRDSFDGLWEGHDINEVASIQGWWNNPQKVLEFYNMRRREVLSVEPNAAHRALVELERDHDVTVITQNVDDLHERAGSTQVIHLHGELLKARPADDEEHRWVIPWTKDINLGDDDAVGSQLRPHIVWFGEGLPMLPLALDVALGDDVDVLIVVGTTLEVYPAAVVATETKAKRVFLIDPTPPTLDVPNVTRITEPATVGVRRVVDELLKA